jgi:hypothetical protein
MGLLNNTAQEYYDGNDFGNYQFTSLKDIINQFMLVYVGEDKIIPKAKRMDVAFHAQRALAELSFDTFKSCKAQEITVPASLQMTLPQDYVNYTKISWVDSAGVKHLLYPTNKTSNPTNPYQNASGDLEFTTTATFVAGSNTITVPGKLTDIVPGMIVVSAHTPSPNNVIARVASAGTNTSLRLANQHDSTSGYVNFYSLISSTIPVQINNSDGSLHHNAAYSAKADGVSLTANSAIITVTAAEVANIKVGMAITLGFDLTGNYGLTSDNTVLAISGNNITMSEVSLLGGSGVTHDIYFISPDIEDSTTWSNYKSQVPSENNNDDYEDDTYWPMDGSRFGLDPQHAQANGSFYIDCVSGKIHFSSNISGKTVILDYISDSLGTDGEMQVHKFAEEAMYKWISHAILSGKANVPEYQVNRLKKERFAAIRTAKLRLSNLKLEELTQILRGKSKQIKH